MKEICIYLTESILCAGMSLLLYRAAVENRFSFRSCRRYLIGAALLSAIMPACRIPIGPGEVIYYVSATTLPAPTAAPAAAPVPLLCIVCYLAVTLLILGLLLAGLGRILRLRHGARIERHEKYRIVETPRVSAPFSFFSDIYLCPDYRDDERRQIIAHEYSHIRHRHTAEKLVMDLLRALLWINPGVWLLGRKLSEVHEFEADRDVLDAGYDAEQYRITLFRHLFGVTPETAASGLRGTLTKKRFAMMNRTARRRTPRLRLALVGLAMAALSGSVSFSAGTPRYLPLPRQQDGTSPGGHALSELPEEEAATPQTDASQPREEVIFVPAPKSPASPPADAPQPREEVVFVPAPKNTTPQSDTPEPRR